MLKAEVRKIFRKKRNELSESDKVKADDLLLIEFQKLQLPFLNTLLSFYPVEENNEPNTFVIARYLSFKNPGLRIAYPKADFSTNIMQAIICEEDDEFIKNAFYIPEPIGNNYVLPEVIDAVLVPLVAFDERGFRVGYGKGFYDRFLSQCRNDCIKIGLSFFDAIESIDDADEFDVPLDFCITPQKVYVF